MARLALLFVVAVVGGASIAGCGSSSSSTTSSTSSSATAAPAAAATTAATSAAGGSAAGGAAAASPAVAQAVAACKSSIQAAPTLTASQKTQLETICQKAANGDEAGVKQAASQVCMEIVKDSVPSGAAQTAALAACPKP